MGMVGAQEMAQAPAAELIAVSPPISFLFLLPNLQTSLASVSCLSLDESVARASCVSESRAANGGLGHPYHSVLEQVPMGEGNVDGPRARHRARNACLGE
jgi:hypothetical protein